jgi:hypothetical protein
MSLLRNNKLLLFLFRIYISLIMKGKQAATPLPLYPYFAYPVADITAIASPPKLRTSGFRSRDADPASCGFFCNTNIKVTTTEFDYVPMKLPESLISSIWNEKYDPP